MISCPAGKNIFNYAVPGSLQHQQQVCGERDHDWGQPGLLIGNIRQHHRLPVRASVFAKTLGVMLHRWCHLWRKLEWSRLSPFDINWISLILTGSTLAVQPQRQIIPAVLSGLAGASQDLHGLFCSLLSASSRFRCPAWVTLHPTQTLSDLVQTSCLASALSGLAWVLSDLVWPTRMLDMDLVSPQTLKVCISDPT